MLICEELFLLLTNDEGKTEGWGTQKGWGLAGAVLTDLLAAQRISLDEHKKDPKVLLRDASPSGSPVLDAAIARLAEKGVAEKAKKFSSLVQDGKLNPEPEIVDSLAAAGVIRVEEKRMLGLVPAKYPILNPAPEREIRARLAQVLLGGQPATINDATDLALLQALGVAHKVLREEAGRLNSRELKRRIQEVAANVQAADAVARAIQTLNTIILTTAIIPAVTSTGSN